MDRGTKSRRDRKAEIIKQFRNKRFWFPESTSRISARSMIALDKDYHSGGKNLWCPLLKELEKSNYFSGGKANFETVIEGKRIKKRGARSQRVVNKIFRSIVARQTGKIFFEPKRLLSNHELKIYISALDPGLFADLYFEDTRVNYQLKGINPKANALIKRTLEKVKRLEYIITDVGCEWITLRDHQIESMELANTVSIIREDLTIMEDSNARIISQVAKQIEKEANSSIYRENIFEPDRFLRDLTKYEKKFLRPEHVKFELKSAQNIISNEMFNYYVPKKLEITNLDFSRKPKEVKKKAMPDDISKIRNAFIAIIQKSKRSEKITSPLLFDRIVSAVEKNMITVDEKGIYMGERFLSRDIFDAQLYSEKFQEHYEKKTTHKIRPKVYDCTHNIWTTKKKAQIEKYQDPSSIYYEEDLIESQFLTKQILGDRDLVALKCKSQIEELFLDYFDKVVYQIVELSFESSKGDYFFPEDVNFITSFCKTIFSSFINSTVLPNYFSDKITTHEEFGPRVFTIITELICDKKRNTNKSIEAALLCKLIKVASYIYRIDVLPELKEAFETKYITNFKFSVDNLKPKLNGFWKMWAHIKSQEAPFLSSLNLLRESKKFYGYKSKADEDAFLEQMTAGTFGPQQVKSLLSEIGKKYDMDKKNAQSEFEELIKSSLNAEDRKEKNLVIFKLKILSTLDKTCAKVEKELKPELLSCGENTFWSFEQVFLIDTLSKKFSKLKEDDPYSFVIKFIKAEIFDQKYWKASAIKSVYFLDGERLLEVRKTVSKIMNIIFKLANNEMIEKKDLGEYEKIVKDIGVDENSEKLIVEAIESFTIDAYTKADEQNKTSKVAEFETSFKDLQSKDCVALNGGFLKEVSERDIENNCKVISQNYADELRKIVDLDIKKINDDAKNKRARLIESLEKHALESRELFLKKRTLLAKKGQEKVEKSQKNKKKQISDISEGCSPLPSPSYSRQGDNEQAYFNIKLGKTRENIQMKFPQDMEKIMVIINIEF